ncbi:MAG: PH domain-containing protein [Planctomycetota bacterium]
MLADEKELLRTCPHWLAYSPLYALWCWFMAVGVIGLLAGPQIGESLHNMSGTIPLTAIGWSALEPPTAWFIVWAVAVLIPAAIMPLFRISFGWLVAVALLLGAGAITLGLRNQVHAAVTGVIDAGFLKAVWESLNWKPAPNPMHYESVMALVFGIGGVIILEFRRGSRVWILTDRRLIARFGIFNKSERDLLYTSIDDIVIHQTFLGSIFNFGTVIPLSRDGLAAASVEEDTRKKSKSEPGSLARPRKKGVKVELGNGKRITIPREPTFYMLWGIPDPRGRKDQILAQIGRGVGAVPRPSGRGAAITTAAPAITADDDE